MEVKQLYDRILINAKIAYSYSQSIYSLNGLTNGTKYIPCLQGSYVSSHTKNDFNNWAIVFELC